MSEFKAKVMYKSKGKAPNGESFMTIKKARGYYEYSERPGKDSIAFILYNKNAEDKKMFGLINESKPPMDERENRLVRMTTAFGGSVDMDKTTQEICQIEVLEEAGYEVPLEKVISIGKTMVSTQSSQMMEGFLVNVTGIEKTHLTEFEKKENSEFEGNSVVWMTIEEVMENSDWKSIFIIMRHSFSQADF